MRFDIVQTEGGLLFLFGNKHLKTLQQKKKAGTSEEASDESNDELTRNPSQISSPGKQIFPAICYWLACQTHNGSAVNLIKIQQALRKCDLEFYL